MGRTHRQDIDCPCCGRRLRGYQPRFLPPFRKGHFHPFRGATPVARRPGHIWITPYAHKDSAGEICAGSLNRFYEFREER